MGQKYAAFDTDGIIIGFYDSVTSPVPSGLAAIEITEDEWKEAFNKRNWKVVDGILTPPSDFELLEEAKAIHITLLQAKYRNAKNAPVEFTTAAGVSSQYATSAEEVENINASILAYEGKKFPAGIWLDNSGVPVEFSASDLQGLLDAINSRVIPSHGDLIAKIAEVKTASNISEVEKVTL